MAIDVLTISYSNILITLPKFTYFLKHLLDSKIYLHTELEIVNPLVARVWTYDFLFFNLIKTLSIYKTSIQKIFIVDFE